MKNNRKVKVILPLVIEPVVSFVLGFLVSLYLSLSLSESLILSSICTLLVAVLDINVRMQVANLETCKKNQEIEERIKQLKILSTLQDSIDNLDNAYFKKWAILRLKRFISDNKAFFKGTNRTNPHAEDTFGIEGIKDTLEYGSIKAVSSVQDYWEDDFTKEYLKVQADLIHNKHVTIQRIFFFPESKFDAIKKVMQEQAKIGVNVYYIFLENEFINPAWKNQDFLLQDNQLLVQIELDSHKFSENEGETEIITKNA